MFRKMKVAAEFNNHGLVVKLMKPTLWGTLRHQLYYPKWVVELNGDNWAKNWRIDGKLMSGERDYEIGNPTIITRTDGLTLKLSQNWRGNVKVEDLTYHEEIWRVTLEANGTLSDQGIKPKVDPCATLVPSA